MSSQAAVWAEGLAKTYPGGARAVVALDLMVRPGEVLGLLGPNGAGKTTTVGMLTTRVRPSAGRAQVGGKDLFADPVGVKRAIGVVSQTNTLDRALTVRQNLLAHGWYFGLRSGDARRAADLLLEAFRLSAWADRQIRALSGGTAQRVMLARAVMHRPAVLFLDEPSAGLDPRSRLDTWETLEHLRGQGQTILLTTHDMDEAQRLCERVAVMDRGCLLALGAPADLIAAHGGPTMIRASVRGGAARFAACLSGRMAGVLAGPVSVEAPAQAASPARVAAPVRVGDGAMGRVLRAAEEVGADLADVAVARPDLERVFLNLTGRSLRQ